MTFQSSTWTPGIFDEISNFSTHDEATSSNSSDLITWSQVWSTPSFEGDTFSTTPPENGDLPSLTKSSTAASCAVFDFALYTVVGGFLCVFGVVGNILSFVVLQLQRSDGAKSSATTLLLRALAVADSLVLVVAIPLYALTPIASYIESLPETTSVNDASSTTTTTTMSTFGSVARSYLYLYPSILPYMWPLYLMPYTATVWLTVLVSADRYAAVCRPFRSAASKFGSGAQTCRQIIFVALFAVVYNIPRFFEYQRGGGGGSGDGGRGGSSDSIELTSGRYTNSTFRPTESPATVAQPSIGLSEFGGNKLYRILYANILYFVVMHGGPILLLAFLNARLITALKAQDRKRKLMSKGRLQVAAASSAGRGGGAGGHQLHQQQQQNQDLTLTLVVVVFVFIFCQTPTFIDHVLWTIFDKDQMQCGHWHYYYTAVGDVLAIFNSSVNFVVYVVASPKFRRGLVDLLCRRLRCRVGRTRDDNEGPARTQTEENRLTNIIDLPMNTQSRHISMTRRSCSSCCFCCCCRRLHTTGNKSDGGSDHCIEISEKAEVITVESPLIAVETADFNLELVN